MATPGLALTVGQEVNSRLAVDGKQIPLPAGTWTIAGLGIQDVDLAGPGASGAIRNIILFLHAGARVVAMAEVNVNTDPADNGWGGTRYCRPTRQLVLATRYRSGWESSCMFIEATAAARESHGPFAWRSAQRLAATVGLVLPDLWLTVGYRVSDRQDLVDLRFHFDPSLLVADPAVPIASLDHWGPEATRAAPARLDAVRALALWADEFDGCIERGVRNQLGSEATAMPQAAAFRSGTPRVDAKLAALDRLYRTGVIDARTLVRQQRRALEEVPASVETADGLSLSVKKNVSFRLLGWAGDTILGIVGSPVPWMVTTATRITQSFVFVFNDRFWEGYWTARSPHQRERMVDFVYIGQRRA